MRISYEEFMKNQAQQPVRNNYSESTQNNNYVRYFSLKDDGDEAIVRFMYDSPSQFDILDVHSINNGKWDVKYNCIYDRNNPMSECPLCKAGVPLQQKFYIKMVQYFNDNGTIRAEARVWERPTRGRVDYVSLIKSYMDEYSPLSDYVFKIKRMGRKGDTNTSYMITPCNPNVYSPAVYKKDETLFENYSVLGSTVMDKSYEELQKEVSCTPGEPTRTSAPQNPTPAPTPTYPQTQQTSAPVPSTPATSQNFQAAPTRMYAPSQTPEKKPWENQQTQFTPRRY